MEDYPTALKIHFRKVENGFLFTFCRDDVGLFGDEFVALDPQQLKVVAMKEFEARLDGIIALLGPHPQPSAPGERPATEQLSSGLIGGLAILHEEMTAKAQSATEGGDR